MISPVTKIAWLDIATKVSKHSAIMKFYQDYAHLARKKDIQVEEILFTDDKVKIKDMYGWTAVKAIRRIEGVMGWCNVVADNQEIMTTYSSLIPVFDSENPRSGFHGETKYPFVIKKISELTADDKIRIRNGSYTPTSQVEFISASIQKSDLTIGPGYEIITRSKFFNGDNIYMYASDPIIEE